MKVQIVNYDPTWPEQYERERDAIAAILQDELVASFHIGSTSVPGLNAKPIIDILLVVEQIDRLDAWTASFEALGYEVMGEFGIAGRRFFRKGATDRTHHVHAFQYDNVTDIERHVAFRDFLRQHPDKRIEYGTLKAQLVAQHSNDREAYIAGKNDFVKEIEREALKWKWRTRA
ncbi:GrpB family protein [Lentibacillus saliphilus]|uniref:GrpB family protein n=1 Tax=Lentibacillus saliphilus TaxID=2737028 RepID=UPI001C2F25C6|nr:GrpB family protein [Lentibacillus saliphilus]